MSDATNQHEPWHDVEYGWIEPTANDYVLRRLAAIERRIDHLEAHAFAQRAAVEYDRAKGEYVVRGRV